MSGIGLSMLGATYAPPALYAFTSFTFLPIVAAGSATGPTLAQMQTAYAGQAWLASYFALGSYQGYQRWTVPQTGSYTIDAGGGMGGDGLLYYGSNIGTLSYGARIVGTFSLTSGDVLEIVVGVKGGSSGGAHGNENGGGGGTFIRNVTTNTLLLVAGGGGGMPSPTYGTTCSRVISQGRGQSVNAGGVTACASTAGYSLTTPTNGYGGNTAGSYMGGAGGGYLSAGANGGTHCSLAYGGGGFNNGLVGGAGNSCYDARDNGGFGGGGGGMLGTPGGAGGYTGGSVGGAWSSYSDYGGGGGSYNVGSSQTNTAGGNNTSLGGSAGAGFCTITKV